MPRQPIPGVVFQPRSASGMQRGINQIADVVRPTLGPRPRMVGVENVSRNKLPEFLDNGALIARRIIQLPDRDADMGAMLIRHLLWRLHEEVGDGTATAAVIFQTIYNRGLRYVVAGGNAMLLRRYLEQGMCEILDELKRFTVRPKGKENLARIAESLCFDPPLARLLGEIFDIVGEYGQVEVRASPRRELERHYTEGMYWPGGIFSPHMIADLLKRRTELTEVALLISDLEIEDPRDLMPVLDLAMEAGLRTLLIVAGKLSDSAIALLLAASREPEKFRVIAVHTPGSGMFEQAAAMEDLAILTGGRPLLKAAGDALRGLTVVDLGHARRAWSERSNFGIVGGKGNARRLRSHIATLRQAFAAASEPAQQTTLRQRIGKLIGGSATLLIGGHAEIEITAREELARRTAGLLRSALREGVVPGGGVTFLACRTRLQRACDASADPDEQAAYGILIRALEEPFRTIVANAGYDAAPVLAEVDRAEEGFGFDVRCEAVVDMAQTGIVDIAAAQRAVIHATVTAAALALTVDTLVHKRKPTAMPGRP